MPTSIKNDKWKKLFDAQNSKKTDNEENTHLIDSYYFIYDCNLNQISFINSAFDTITGYDSTTFKIDDLIEHMHPDDRDYFFSCEEKDLAFKNNLSYNENFNYLFSYTYRICISTGEYIRIRQTCQALEVSNSGHLTKTLVIHQRIENFDERPINDHRIYDKTRNIYLDSENCYKLTKRELEVLNLIQEGYNSVDIADKLCTSKFTIDTHRKNILNKTNSANFIELLSKLSFAN